MKIYLLPYKTYIKTIKAKLFIYCKGPFGSPPTGILLYKDEQKFSTWTKEQDDDFKYRNLRIMMSGYLKETDLIIK